eukprot:7378032-Prymnesium_polylepis.1
MEARRDADRVFFHTVMPVPVVHVTLATNTSYLLQSSSLSHALTQQCQALMRHDRTLVGHFGQTLHRPTTSSQTSPLLPNSGSHLATHHTQLTVPIWPLL